MASGWSAGVGCGSGGSTSSYFHVDPYSNLAFCDMSIQCMLGFTVVWRCLDFRGTGVKKPRQHVLLTTCRDIRGRTSHT